MREILTRYDIHNNNKSALYPIVHSTLLLLVGQYYSQDSLYFTNELIGCIYTQHKVIITLFLKNKYLMFVPEPPQRCQHVPPIVIVVFIYCLRTDKSID